MVFLKFMNGPMTKVGWSTLLEHWGGIYRIESYSLPDMLTKHVAVGLPALGFLLLAEMRIGGRSSKEKIGNLHGEKAVKRLDSFYY